MRPEGSRRPRDALLRKINHGEELQATLIVHGDGRKEWDWMRHEGQGSGDLKTAIEQAIDADPLGFQSVVEVIDTTTAIGQFFFQITGAFAELERNLMRGEDPRGLSECAAAG